MPLDKTESNVKSATNTFEYVSCHESLVCTRIYVFRIFRVRFKSLLKCTLVQYSAPAIVAVRYNILQCSLCLRGVSTFQHVYEDSVESVMLTYRFIYCHHDVAVAFTAPTYYSDNIANKSLQIRPDKGLQVFSKTLYAIKNTKMYVTMTIVFELIRYKGK